MKQVALASYDLVPSARGLSTYFGDAHHLVISIVSL